MNVIVHYPKSTKDIAILQNKVATVHADAVLRYIQSLPCSQEQRHKMLDEIKKACRDLR